MKTRKHINEIFLEGLAEWLRKQNREADAVLVDGIDPATFVRSGYKSNGVYGSTGNPNKGNGGKITIPQLGYTVGKRKRNGLTLSGSVTLADFIALIPPEIRPKYIGNLGTSDNTLWDPASVGLDIGRPGCRCFGDMGVNGQAFIVVVGSDEDPTDPATIEKYLPFTFGFTKSHITPGVSYGAATYYRNANNVYDTAFMALVWKSTSPAPEEKPINQDLPILTFTNPTNKAPERYRSVPPITVTVDWEVLRNKYTQKTHYNQLWIDAIAAALHTAGDDYTANLIKRINPETFVPFQLSIDNTKKTHTFLGAQCKTSKLYFESITFNFYLAAADSTRVFPNDFAWVYAPEAGISWNTVDTQALANAYTQSDLVADKQYHYFYKHLPKGTKLTRAQAEESYPFFMTGIDYVWPVPSDASTSATFNFYNDLQENFWTGPSTTAMVLRADLI